jgi:hypothetical protein
MERMRQFAIGLLMAGMSAMAAAADESPLGPAPGLYDSLKSFITEDDIRTLFDFMREAALAAAKGETVTLPPELAFKLAILRKRLEKEGGAAMNGLKSELDRRLDEALQDLCRERQASHLDKT